MQNTNFISSNVANFLSTLIYYYLVAFLITKMVVWLFATDELLAIMLDREVYVGTLLSDKWFVRFTQQRRAKCLGE
jgi:hypothetical protein